MTFDSALIFGIKTTHIVNMIKVKNKRINFEAITELNIFIIFHLLFLFMEISLVAGMLNP